MKQILLLLFMWLLFTTAQAQKYQYVPFPDSNAVWSEVYWKPISQPCPRWEYNKYALFNEDTLINGIRYHKLFHTHASEITKENSTCIGGIREDSIRKIWYAGDYLIKEGVKEFNFYNFSLKVGDTVETEFLQSTFVYAFIISKIDTLLFESKYRRVFSINNNEVTWIEGIGNVEGLLIPNSSWPTNGEDNDLICFHQNDTLLYYNTGPEGIYDDCVPSFIANGVAILPNTEIKVYPNPVSENRVYFENLDFETLELYDVNACLLYEANISGQKNYVLNFSPYPMGTYFYRLKTKGLLPVGGKLIKNQ